ncbi:hypothetical protein TNCV_1412001 [Trichonephila clavipes]|nr:hypothetical protein TNCV_1412001 [Trichonephila clavipes]
MASIVVLSEHNNSSLAREVSSDESKSHSITPLKRRPRIPRDQLVCSLPLTQTFPQSSRGKKKTNIPTEDHLSEAHGESEHCCLLYIAENNVRHMCYVKKSRW